MKVVEPPNRFFPDRAFSAEDVNRNLSHASNMIKNDQDARYVYSSIRIPMATVSSYQERGPDEPLEGMTGLGGLPVAGTVKDGTGPKVMCPNDHESISIFSFVPPMDMKIVSTDLYVSGASDNEDQITDADPMVVKAQWIADDGGEGFPPRPKSVLPEGLRTTKDPEAYKYHDQISINVTAQDGYFAITDNGEYTLRAGKCYRVKISNPDIPSISKLFGDADKLQPVYDQTWFWRYPMAWIQLNLKYDKWDFDKINRPDVNFYTAKDKIERSNADGTGLQDQIDDLNASRQETEGKLRYPKPELYYFGLGNLDGMWNRPNTDICPQDALAPLGELGQSYITQQTEQEILDTGPGDPSLAADVTNFVLTDSYKRHCVPDLDFDYSSEVATVPGAGVPPGPYDLGIRDAHLSNNFQFQSVWRVPMSPRLPGPTNGKQIYGYSLGVTHGVTQKYWQGHGDNYPPLIGPSGIEAVPRHFGYNFHARLGHGVAFNETVPSTTLAGMPNNYDTLSLDGDDTPGNKTTPTLRAQNEVDGGGLANTSAMPSNLGWNNTSWGSTAIPQTTNGAAGTSAITGAYDHYGLASGFPGDYLAEIHSGSQYGTDPDNLTGLPGPYENISISKGQFRAPGVDIPHPAAFADLNNQNDLFMILNTFMAAVPHGGGKPEPPDVMEDFQRRNFQKVYVLLWVL